MALPAVPTSGCYIGTSLGGNTLANYQTELHTAQSSANFKGFRSYYKLDSTTISADDTTNGGTAAIGWFSFRSDSTDNHTVYPWAQVSAGTHDAKIIAIANALHTYGHPCWVTFNHEPVHSAKTVLTVASGKSANVCTVQSDSTSILAATIASEWRAAYEHFVTVVKARYTAQGWTLNIAFAPIMQQLNYTGTRLPASQWVPSVGVDWFAIDAYPAAGATFYSAFQAFNTWAMANIPNVPLANCETTTQPTGRPVWLYTNPAASGSLNYDIPNKMPNLKMWFYWNQNGGTSDFDSGGSDTASIAAMANLIIAPGVATSASLIPPAITITAPTVNQFFESAATVTLTATVTDADTVASVTASLDAADPIACTALGGDVYQHSFGVVAAGAHTITVTATDANVTPTTSQKTVPFTVRVQPPVNMPPTVVVSGPTDVVILPATALVTCTATDTDGIASVKVSLDSGTAVAMTPASLPAPGGAFSLDLGVLAEGNHRVDVTATDTNATPLSATASRSFLVTSSGGGSTTPPLTISSDVAEIEVRVHQRGLA